MCVHVRDQHFFFLTDDEKAVLSLSNSVAYLRPMKRGHTLKPFKVLNKKRVGNYLKFIFFRSDIDPFFPGLVLVILILFFLLFLVRPLFSG